MKSAADYWEDRKAKLAAEKDLPVFKTWNSLLSVPLYHYDEALDYYLPKVQELLEARMEDDLQRWKGVLKEPFVGHKFSSHNAAQRSILGVPCTAWTLKTAHHLLTYEAISGKSLLDYDLIVDFGAGIGEASRMIRSLGYKKRLAIFDLPETARVSSFYLTEQKMAHEVAFDLADIQVPENTLFIGTWSLSEVPLEYRNRIVHYFNRCDFLIIYQKAIFDVDNGDYFENVFPEIANVTIKTQSLPIHHRPQDMSQYVIGSGV